MFVQPLPTAYQVTFSFFLLVRLFSALSLAFCFNWVMWAIFCGFGVPYMQLKFDHLCSIAYVPQTLFHSACIHTSTRFIATWMHSNWNLLSFLVKLFTHIAMMMILSLYTSILGWWITSFGWRASCGAIAMDTCKNYFFGL